MAALRDKNGNVVGAVDTPGHGSCVLRTCSRTVEDRVRLGCEPRRSVGFQEMAIDEEDRRIADSGFARRVLKQCAGTLDRNDMHAIVDMLTATKKVNSADAERLKNRM